MHHKGHFLFLLGQMAMLPLLSRTTVHKPNIVFILADDLGYGDLHCYGQKNISTPNIDSLASRGMLFTQAYAGAPVSAPSRACLMTGQHTGHTRVRGNKEYWPGQPTVTYGVNKEYAVTGQMPYDPRHRIIPEIMKDGGYHTAIFGKWAGGYEGSVSTPDKRGIDEFYGYICQFQAHLYFPNFLNSFSRFRGDTAVGREILQQNILHPMSGPEYFLRREYSADLIHRRALSWLARQDSSHPFIAFLTYTLPHAELAQPDDSIPEGYKRRFFTDRTWGGSPSSRYNAVEHTHAQFAAMVTRLDKYVGQVVELLRSKGLEENTLIIFTSDNGPHEEGGADPAFFGHDGKLRGLKRQCLEGGIRVPFIACWPGHIRPGSVSPLQIAFWDVMPTLCDISGLRMPKDKKRKDTPYGEYSDGISFAPTLTGKGEQKTHPWLYWEFGETDQMALRMGDWKLLVKSGQPHLYDLSRDLREEHDVAASHPDIAAEMIRILISQHTPSPDFSVTLPALPQ